MILVRRSFPLLALATLAVACSSLPPPPPATFRTRIAVVRAPDERTAARTAALVTELEPKVRALLPDTVRTPIEVWVEPRLSPIPKRSLFGVAAYTVTRSEPDGTDRSSVIHLSVSSAGDRSVLAHELTHARLGPAWSHLPDPIVEGICEFVASRIAPRAFSTVKARHLAMAASVSDTPASFFASDGHTVQAGILSLSVESSPPFPKILALDLNDRRDVRSATEEACAYAVGYVVVTAIDDRTGIATLDDLSLMAAASEQKKVSLRWILDAAGIPDAAALRAIVASRMTVAGASEIAGRIAPDLARVAVLRFHAPAVSPDPGTYLGRFRPTLTVDGVAVPLRSIPAFARSLRKAWPVTGKRAPRRLSQVRLVRNRPRSRADVASSGAADVPKED